MMAPNPTLQLSSGPAIDPEDPMAEYLISKRKEDKALKKLQKVQTVEGETQRRDARGTTGTQSPKEREEDQEATRKVRRDERGRGFVGVAWRRSRSG
jgi:hypothetical protein